MSDTGYSPYYPWDNKRIQDPDSPSDGFNVAHPDRGAQGIPYVMITHGLNADFTALPESQWVRCRKCGFPGINKARSPKGWGTGISHDWSNLADQGLPSAVPGGQPGMLGWGSGDLWGGYYESMPADPIVTSGCPQCGTYIYD